MTRTKSTLLAFVAIVLLPMAANAGIIVIDFEEFAPTGGLVNISPTVPYAEDGFTLTPTNNQSAVFDSAAASTMVGNNTDWFGFAESNTPTLTLTSGGSAFNLLSVLIGPSSIASGTSISMTILGNLFSGVTVTQTFTNISTATLAGLNWTNLASVDFTSTDDAGLDDITVSVPEPGTLALFGIGLLGMAAGRRRRKI